MFVFSSAVVFASTFATLAASAAHALAPRASPSAGQTYYRPPYTCANDIVEYGETHGLATSDYRTDSALLDCEYDNDLGSACSYSTTTGELLIPSTNCPATLAATTGCVYECALTETGGTSLLEALYIANGDELQCEYWTGNQWLFCLYVSLLSFPFPSPTSVFSCLSLSVFFSHSGCRLCLFVPV
ncbi:hypothetical protein ACG7TL_005163 [Trametes sanguinea]